MKVIEKDIYGEPLTASYEDYLIESLKDPKEAKEYLNAAIEDEDFRVFLLALRNVAEAFGIAKLAKKAGLNRENIYRMLSEKGNPTYASLHPLLRAIELRLSIELAKTEASAENYEIEFEETEFESVSSKYTKPTIRKPRTYSNLPAFYNPQASSCEIYATA